MYNIPSDNCIIPAKMFLSTQDIHPMQNSVKILLNLISSVIMHGRVNTCLLIVTGILLFETCQTSINSIHGYWIRCNSVNSAIVHGFTTD